MSDHVFGGEWTQEKLERIRKYLEAYMGIFSVNEKARYFTTYYVDAFAGTGTRKDRIADSTTDMPLLGFENEPEVVGLYKGSASIALEIKNPFDRYVFIDRSKDRVEELEKLRVTYPKLARSIVTTQGEANEFIQHWCVRTNWKRNRAVVFLDPYGMQVSWATIEAIAKTEAIDLWLLFPIGVAINRLLLNKQPPPEHWSKALTHSFGTDTWKDRFYKKEIRQTLFGFEEAETKVAGYEDIKAFFLERLETVFTRVAKNPLLLTNSVGTPIYLLCFAAGAKKGADVAVNIAQSILKH